MQAQQKQQGGSAGYLCVCSRMQRAMRNVRGCATPFPPTPPGEPTVTETEDGGKRYVKSTGVFSGIELHMQAGGRQALVQQ
jgi:hypothetical protein